MNRNWRVLVADDDRELCALIQTVLKGPYDFALCHDAEEALAAIDREPPFDVMVCDFMLPGISGLDLIEKLRSDYRTRDLPVLMISGHVNYEMNSRAKTAGANKFLNKPFTISQLRNAVEELLSPPTPA